ncbi:crossover junction endodeoxyribonuclease RuvC [Jatrophihabitans sp.]|jgi:crossover junction endodeoxyribonuclease RuvC|uniref:crossover junction endodeoxyribonuclease RuvC n=1 Tax=Jatrophihabitans sp. TaxID=1932789 RepID=UPI002F18E95D
MRVLGVDPGLTRCGIGVVQGSTGRALSLVHVEVVRTPAEDPLATRLLVLADALTAAVSEYRPDVVVVERVFAQQNVRTVTGTAQAAGLAMVAAARQGIAVHLHTPSEVKAAITGSGTADKAQVTAMVTRILKLDVAPTPADAADALALAICHIWRGAAQARLDAAVTHARAGARVPGSGSRPGSRGSIAARDERGADRDDSAPPIGVRR